MFFCRTKLITLSLLAVFCFANESKAQEKATPPNEQATGNVEYLRKRLEAQEAQIKEMKEILSRQNEFIERQQKVLEGLQQKIGQGSNASPAPSAATTNIKAGDDKPAAIRPAPSPDPGKVKFNGLIQAWYGSGDAGYSDTFLLRRAELRFSGQISPHVKWMMMIDPAKALSLNKTYTTINGSRVVSDATVNASSRILQDAYITLDYHKNLQVQLGQFKVPLSLEGLQANARLDTVERALFASDRGRGGNYGAVWDTGVMIRGTLSDHADYQAGLFNGSGEHHNDVDKNDQKAVIGRFVVRPPFMKGLQIGGSGAWGGKARADRLRRDRVGAEIVFSRSNFTFKSEWLTGKDLETHRLGYYTHFAYRLTPKLEAIFRFDSWDPDRRLETDSLNVTERDYVTGFNYFITENNVKFQFNYVRKTFAQNIASSRNLLLANLQTAW